VAKAWQLVARPAATAAPDVSYSRPPGRSPPILGRIANLASSIPTPTCSRLPIAHLPLRHLHLAALRPSSAE